MLNQIKITGIISREPQILYTNKKGQNKYQFFIDCKRTSGVIDTIPVITSENDLKTGQRVCIEGHYSSFNKIEDDKRRLKLNVDAKIISIEYDDKDINEVELEGFICKNPLIRTTPAGRTIADVLLAINRINSNYSDYIPIIFWESTIKMLENLKIGDKIKIKGRVQSRIYTKENIEYTAYEVSASDLKILENL